MFSDNQCLANTRFSPQNIEQHTREKLQSIWIVEAVHANAFCGGQVVAGVDVDVNCVFVELVGIRLLCP